MKNSYGLGGGGGTAIRNHVQPAADACLNEMK